MTSSSSDRKRRAPAQESNRVASVAKTSSEPPSVESKYRKEDVRPDAPGPPVRPLLCASALVAIPGQPGILYDTKNEFFREPPFPDPWPKVPERDSKGWEPGNVGYLFYTGTIEYMMHNAAHHTRWGLCWEVYNIDFKNINSIASLIPDTTRAMAESRDGHRHNSVWRSRAAAFHLGRVSWELSIESFPEGLLPPVVWPIVIAYVDGTNCPVVSIRRDHVDALLKHGRLPQLPTTKRVIVQDATISKEDNYALSRDLKSRLCSGRVPLGRRGRLRPEEINFVDSMATLDLTLVYSPVGSA